MAGEEGWCCRACRELSPARGRSRCMAVGMFAVRSEAATLDQGVSSGYISRLVHDGASDSDRQAGEIAEGSAPCTKDLTSATTCSTTCRGWRPRNCHK